MLQIVAHQLSRLSLASNGASSWRWAAVRRVPTPRWRASYTNGGEMRRVLSFDSASLLSHVVMPHSYTGQVPVLVYGALTPSDAVTMPQNLLLK